MRSIVGTGICTAFFLAALGSHVEVSAAPGDVLSTTRTNVNVRSGPSTDADVIGRINSGDTVIEVNTWSEWHLVRLQDDGSQGWVYSPLLEPASNTPNATSTASVANTASVADTVGAANTAGAADTAGAANTARVANTAPRVTAFDGDLVGDPKKGEQVFYKCGSCHTTVPGIHAQGPSLVGVFGRAPAGAAGYRYSGSMQAFARDGAIWDEATLDEFIRRPGRLVEGTSMPFSGVRDPQDRRDLIAYLQQLSN